MSVQIFSVVLHFRFYQGILLDLRKYELYTNFKDKIILVTISTLMVYPVLKSFRILFSGELE